MECLICCRRRSDVSLSGCGTGMHPMCDVCIAALVKRAFTHCPYCFAPFSDELLADHNIFKRHDIMDACVEVYNFTDDVVNLTRQLRMHALATFLLSMAYLAAPGLLLLRLLCISVAACACLGCSAYVAKKCGTVFALDVAKQMLDVALEGRGRVVLTVRLGGGTGKASWIEWLRVLLISVTLTPLLVGCCADTLVVVSQYVLPAVSTTLAFWWVRPQRYDVTTQLYADYT